jgi:hypothetical protein
LPFIRRAASLVRLTDRFRHALRPLVEPRRAKIRPPYFGFDCVAPLSHVASNERRGLVLIKLFMDEIRFNEAGNEITLIKYKRPATALHADKDPSRPVSETSPKLG